MRKVFTRLLSIAVCTMAICSCSDDKESDDAIVIKDKNGSVQLVIKNPQKWAAGAQQIATQLNADAMKQLEQWQSGLETQFKQMEPRLAVCHIVDECASEAQNVAEQKIANPFAFFTTGDDCLANLVSIRNSLLGSLDGTPAEASVMAVTMAVNAELAQKVSTQLAAAVSAVQAIPQPLNKNTQSAEALAAIAACQTLAETLGGELKPCIASLEGMDSQLQAVANNYVDAVVLPSLNDARDAAAALMQTVGVLVSAPTESNVQATIAAYVKARGALDLCASFVSL